MIKLIASDMDGTLLNGDKKISEDFYPLLKELNDKGIIMAFASGRNLQALQKLVPEEYYPNIMFIPNNGNNIIYKGEVLYSKTIRMEDIKNIKEAISNIKSVRSIVCIDNIIYTDSIKNWFIGRLRGYKQYLKKDVSELKGNPEKCTLFTEPEDQDKVLESLKHLESTLNIVASGKRTIDISAKGVNKGTAIEFVKSYFNINYDEVAVFGDYLNDYEMMDTAYYSYAMKNAHPKLKEKARFEADANTNNGVIKEIKKLI